MLMSAGLHALHTLRQRLSSAFHWQLQQGELLSDPASESILRDKEHNGTYDVDIVPVFKISKSLPHTDSLVLHALLNARQQLSHGNPLAA